MRNADKKVVIFGGGTGLSIVLRGLKTLTNEITAVVTVADDGGGSGVLREDLGMLPPGDIRNCIISLADASPEMERLMQHRFKEGYLKGQSFGNLLIAAMNEMHEDFEHAVREVSKIFRIKGKVLPMTLTDTNIVAELSSGESIFGEHLIPEYVSKTNDPIKKISLVPSSCQPLNETIQALQEADIIVFGPGSLYTSVIPNLLVHGIPEHVSKAKGKVFYVCNMMTQPGETDGYDVVDHIKALKNHGKEIRIDSVIVNNRLVNEEVKGLYEMKHSTQVMISDKQKEFLKEQNIKILEDDLIEIEKNYIRHNAVKLSEILLS